MKNRSDHLLERIAVLLMSNTRFLNNPGLFNGKMGIAIFFYHYARFTDNKMYEDFADSLIDNICEDLHPGMSVDFKNGLTGIGWGIEHLVQNGFLESDTDEALAEIDSAAYSAFMNIPFLIRDDDLNGLGLYFLSRIRGRENDENIHKVVNIKTKLIYFTDSCERLLTKEKWFGLNVPKPSIEQLNSILFFLNETDRIGLFPVKTKRLLDYIPHNPSLKDTVPDIDRYTFWSLSRKMSGRNAGKLPYEILNIAFLDNGNTGLPDENTLVEEFIKCGWNALLYSVDFTKNEKIKLNFEHILDLFSEETHWDNFEKKINAANLGLYNGLAGLGMSILQFSKSLVKEQA